MANHGENRPPGHITILLAAGAVTALIGIVSWQAAAPDSLSPRTGTTGTVSTAPPVSPTLPPGWPLSGDSRGADPAGQPPGPALPQQRPADAPASHDRAPGGRGAPPDTRTASSARGRSPTPTPDRSPRIHPPGRDEPPGAPDRDEPPGAPDRDEPPGAPDRDEPPGRRVMPPPRARAGRSPGSSRASRPSGSAARRRRPAARRPAPPPPSRPRRTRTSPPRAAPAARRPRKTGRWTRRLPSETLGAGPDSSPEPGGTPTP